MRPLTFLIIHPDNVIYDIILKFNGLFTEFVWFFFPKPSDQMNISLMSEQILKLFLLSMIKTLKRHVNLHASDQI